MEIVIERQRQSSNELEQPSILSSDQPLSEYLDNRIKSRKLLSTVESLITSVGAERAFEIVYSKCKH